MPENIKKYVRIGNGLTLSEEKKFEPGTLEFNLLNKRQMAPKTIANASYGYYAFPASKWYSKEYAESITSFGRYWIKKGV